MDDIFVICHIRFPQKSFIRNMIHVVPSAGGNASLTFNFARAREPSKTPCNSEYSY